MTPNIFQTSRRQQKAAFDTLSVMEIHHTACIDLIEKKIKELFFS